MPRTYIPDHIRLNRTDRLVHIRESLLLVMQRYLPAVWNDRAAYDRVNRLQQEVFLIDDELHHRKMACRQSLRASRQPAYEQSRR